MKKFFNRILFAIPFVKRYAQKQYQLLRSYFQGASVNRFVGDWLSGLDTINRGLRGEYITLLSRSRDLAINNDYIRGYIKRCVVNIVGPEGFQFQSRAIKNDKPDDAVNDMIENSWYDWCKREYASYNGELSFNEILKLAVKQWKRDGNVLVRKVIGNDVNKYGFAVELLDIDKLDIKYNDEYSNGNVVIMGVEYDGNNRRVAYWIKSIKLSDEVKHYYAYNSLRESVRVPADEIIHFFTRDYPGQVIGYPATASAMLSLHNLKGYEDSALTNARIGASKVGFLQSVPVQGISKSYEGDAEDDDGNAIKNISAGEIEVLPEGMEFKSWDPAYPTGEFPSFVKHFLRRIATGLAVAYANWTGDLEAVNFSSMRSGLIDERDGWKEEQKSLVEGLIVPIFNEWLKYAMLSGAVKISYAEYDRVNKPEFIGRRWDWVDPESDINAKVIAVKNNLTTLTDVMAEIGVDFDDYIRRRKRELEKLKDIKLLEQELMPDKVVKNLDEENMITVPLKNNGNGKKITLNV